MANTNASGPPAAPRSTICDKLDELARADAAVIVNPNNPDGRLCDAAHLSALAREMGARGKSLIVDEAFIDFLPRENSLAPLLPLPGALVLRSFGKTYGLAGLAARLRARRARPHRRRCAPRSAPGR